MSLSVGVENSLKAIAAAKELALAGVAIAKNGVTLSDLPKVMSALVDLKNLVDAAPKALPEFKDLNPAEVGQVSEALYAAVKEVVEAVK